MKNSLRYILLAGLFAAAGSVLTGCSEEHTDTISLTSTSVGGSPIEVETMYFCDHTNWMGKRHNHPEDCGFRNCPRLDQNGSLVPAVATGASCPDTTSGGLGIRTELESFTGNTTALLENVKHQALSSLTGKVGESVSASAEGAGKLNTSERARLTGSIQRDLLTSFLKKWDEVTLSSFQAKLMAHKAQILQLTAAAGGTMGCGQKNSVGIEITIPITITLHANAIVKGSIKSGGKWTRKEINWVTFAIDISMGLKGKGLIPNRKVTSCNCTTGEEHKKEPEDKGALPRRYIPDLLPLPLEKKRTVTIRAENLEGFDVTNAEVFILREKRTAEGKKNALTLLGPTAMGGFACYEIVSSLAGRGKNLVTRTSALKSVENDLIAYSVPKSESPCKGYGFDREGNPAERDFTTLGTFEGKDIVVLDNADREFKSVHRMSRGAETTELSSIKTELEVFPTRRIGELLKGTLTVHASKKASQEYQFHLMVYAPGFAPEVVSLEKIEANTKIPLESLKLIAMKPGENQISVEIRPVRK